MEILAQKNRDKGQSVSTELVGDYFSADFYERIYQASISKESLQLQVIQSKVPLIGGLIDRLRTMVHEVIVFYLNQFVSEQARINELTISLIKEMGAEIEKLGKQMAEKHDGAEGDTPAE